MRRVVIWAALGLAIGVPLLAAAFSPLLQWRDPIYIAAGFAGICALALLLVQPLLIAGALPMGTARATRRVHAVIGGTLIAAVFVHIAGLWITSPPDVIDVLLLRSPTPFGVWGALALWAGIAAALVAALRRKLRIRHKTWRALHLGAAGTLVCATILHAVLIEGAMELFSKLALCALVLAATVYAALKTLR